MEKKFKIQRVSSELLGQVTEHRIPCGLFLAREGHSWVAVDNTSGDAWTEEFSRKRQAICWLKGKFEAGDKILRLHTEGDCQMSKDNQTITIYTIVYTAADADRCRFHNPEARDK